MTTKHEELCAKIRALAGKGSMAAQLCEIVEEYAARIVSLEDRVVAAETSRERLLEQSVRDQARIAALEPNMEWMSYENANASGRSSGINVDGWCSSRRN